MKQKRRLVSISNIYSTFHARSACLCVVKKRATVSLDELFEQILQNLPLRPENSGNGGRCLRDYLSAVGLYIHKKFLYSPFMSSSRSEFASVNNLTQYVEKLLGDDSVTECDASRVNQETQVKRRKRSAYTQLKARNRQLRNHTKYRFFIYCYS